MLIHILFHTRKQKTGSVSIILLCKDGFKSGGRDDSSSLLRNRAVNAKSTPSESFPVGHMGVVNMSIPSSSFTVSK